MNQMPEPNWEALYEISARAQVAQQTGQMDRDLWRSLMGEAVVASNGLTDVTAFLGKYAKTEWTLEFRREEEGKGLAA